MDQPHPQCTRIWGLRNKWVLDSSFHKIRGTEEKLVA